MLNRLDLAEDELQESFMYSLLWNYRNGKGIYICHINYNFNVWGY